MPVEVDANGSIKAECMSSFPIKMTVLGKPCLHMSWPTIPAPCEYIFDPDTQLKAVI